MQARGWCIVCRVDDRALDAVAQEYEELRERADALMRACAVEENPGERARLLHAFGAVCDAADRLLAAVALSGMSTPSSCRPDVSVAN